jgi:transposase
VRPVYAAEINGERRIVCADLPPTCLDKGKAGASLIAHTVISKIEDHDPLYRQRLQIKRDAGLDVPESTIENWFNAGSFWLEALARRLKELLPAAGYQQMDESPIKVMVKPTNGKSTQGFMWLRHSPPLRIVTFDFDLSRSREVMKRLIDPGFKGIIQTDGYCVYDPLGTTPGITHAGCHGHARRGFERALTNDKKRATFALNLYRLLFAIEEEAGTAGSTPQQRLALRTEKSVPLMAQLHQWLTAEVKEVKPKSSIGKAILYTLGRWTELSHFLKDGRIEISNNLIENRVRPFALGRRNWLFAGSEDGAQRLAAAYTVLGTGKLHGVNTPRYLTSVLHELPLRQANDIDDLLPMNWKDPDAPRAQTTAPVTRFPTAPTPFTGGIRFRCGFGRSGGL